jgi:hypothetical protein
MRVPQVPVVALEVVAVRVTRRVIDQEEAWTVDLARAKLALEQIRWALVLVEVLPILPSLDKRLASVALLGLTQRAP